jgi:16S rRNA (cytidine1402-2'-O)-methyltransferase
VTEPLRGEVTLVIEGRPAVVNEDDPVQQAARAVLEVMLDPSLKPRARAKALAALTGLDAHALYDRLRGA